MIRMTDSEPAAAAELEALLDGLPWYIRAVAGHGPIGFKAGDTNFYRYVGNDPPNSGDPSGLQPPPAKDIGGSSGNIPEPNPIMPHLFDPPTKEETLNGVTFCRRKDMPDAVKGCQKKGVSQETWWAGNVPDGWLVGPFGCGPCVGVILVPEKPGSGKIYVLHFSGGEYVNEGLKTCGFITVMPGKGVYGGGGGAYWPAMDVGRKGYKAIICGCESNPSDKGVDKERLRTLRTVCGALGSYGVKIECYVPAPNVGVDKNGKPHWTTPDALAVDKFEK